MHYTVYVKQEADAEALEAFLYYEEKQEGLGLRFLDALTTYYKILETNPDYFGILKADKKGVIRDVKVPDFPFVIIYEIIADNVFVYAVHNTYRKQAKNLGKYRKRE